jgi:predicted regulator of amino acid metabolism with ACT domain
MKNQEIHQCQFGETQSCFDGIFHQHCSSQISSFLRNHLKNQFGDTNVPTLQNARNELKKTIEEDLPKIKSLHSNTNLTVCVIPRAKAEGSYSDNQKLFKRVISSVVDKLSGLANGTNYIIRQTNTKTTHMNKSGYGGDGDMPYVGITKATCRISNEVRGKDILLIDDIYTKDVNIDEDAIQALLYSGAKSVIFYAVAKTFKGGIKTIVKTENLNLLKLSLKETFLLLKNENDLNNVALLRGYTKSTIINHLVEIADILGKDVVKKFQPPSSTIRAVNNAIQKLGERDKLRPIFEELGEQISFDDIKLSLIFIE